MVDYEAGDLRIEGNSYHVQDKRKFLAYASMLAQDKAQCFDFAYGMSYGHTGEHRDSRSGGSEHRTKGQIFINTFQGKMAEYAVYRYLISRNIELPEPDTRTYELGKWDSFDLDVQGLHISVKSTKSFGDLLLLETKDWNENGEYKPNIENGTAKYDYTMLVRFTPDGEGIMKENRLLYQKDDDIPNGIRELLIEKVRDIQWKYDFPGFIYYSELIKMIRDKHIIPKNAMLNGRTKMDAENYYFQTGNMHSMMELYTGLVGQKDDRKRIKRKCPECGCELVLRKGPYSVFWGCTGFPINGCRHQEPIEQRT